MSPDEYTAAESSEVDVGGSRPHDSANNRTFLVLSSLLTGILLLLSLGTLGFLVNGKTVEYNRQVAVIETQNAVIMATNVAVTQTIEAMDKEHLAMTGANSTLDKSVSGSTRGNNAVDPNQAEAAADENVAASDSSADDDDASVPESADNEALDQDASAGQATSPVAPETVEENSAPAAAPELTAENEVEPGTDTATEDGSAPQSGPTVIILGVTAEPVVGAEGGAPEVESPELPAVVGELEGYPPAPPESAPPAGYPELPTAPPIGSGDDGNGEEATPIGGATPNPPGAPTLTPAAPLPTATIEPSVTPTEEATVIIEQQPTVTAPVEPTAPAEPTATATTMPVATGTAPPVEPTASPTDPAPTPTAEPGATTAPQATSSVAPLPSATPAPPAQLPQTGLADWSFALIGLALILIIFSARRLRRA